MENFKYIQVCSQQFWLLLLPKKLSFWYVLVHFCHGIHVEVKGQLVSVSLSTMCFLGFELRLSGLAVSVLTH